MTKRILDVGCGGGRYHYHSAVTKSLDETFSLDVEIPQIKKVSRFIRGDVKNLPFRNNSFDVVYCYAVLEHIDKPLEGLNECLRVSRQGVHVRTDGLLFLPNFTTLDHKFFTLHHYYVPYPRWLKMFILKIANLLINRFTLPLLRRAKMYNDLDYYSARWNYYFYAKTKRERVNWLKENTIGNSLEIGCAAGFIASYAVADVGLDINPYRVKLGKIRRPEKDFIFVYET